MQLKTIVKVGGINNLSDARYCAAMGVDFLGFPLDSTLPNAINEEDFIELHGWISGIQAIGEYHQAPESWPEGIMMLELNASQSPPLPKLPYLLKLNLDDTIIEEAEVHLQKQPEATYFVLESNQAELQPEQLDWVKKVGSTYPILLGFGINADNVLKLIEELPIKGIALKGGQEERPGYKDYDELADILELLELDAV